jgi:hypothetical protein
LQSLIGLAVDSDSDSVARSSESFAATRRIRTQAGPRLRKHRERRKE